VRSLREYARNRRLDVVLTTCLFLASKVEEQPRRIRDAINCVYVVRKQLLAQAQGTRFVDTCAPSEGGDAETLSERGWVHGNGNGGAPGELKGNTDLARSVKGNILSLDRGYWDLKESVVDTEQLVLRILGFDLETFMSYRLLLNYARSLRARPVLVEVAWALLNDSLFSPACCLALPSHAQAVAALDLAQRLLTAAGGDRDGENEDGPPGQRGGLKLAIDKDMAPIRETSTGVGGKGQLKKHTFANLSTSTARTVAYSRQGHKSEGRFSQDGKFEPLDFNCHDPGELRVNSRMWNVLGAQGKDVQAWCDSLLHLYEEGPV